MSGALNNLEPAAVWRIFAEICAIPHISGHESALAGHFADKARAAGLKVKFDRVGNLRVDRAAAPGGERFARVILQAHLDMVGQADPGRMIDFLRDPIVPESDGRWVWASGTTLGADNGIGAALALAAVLDPESTTAPLAALFTVSEEVGLVGAGGAEPEMLAGDRLINLDGGEYFCVGCAGGVRTELEFAPGMETSPAGDGVEISVTGLRGGHSGEQIDEARGNALIFLGRFLSSRREVLVSSIDGGSADNAIPREATAVAVTTGEVAELMRAAAEFRELLAGEFEAPERFEISVRPTAAPATVWEADFRRVFPELLGSVANGALGFDERLGIVRSSSNLAIATSSTGRVVLHSSQRGMTNGERDLAADRVIAHFRSLSPLVTRRNVYPGWEASPSSKLLAEARKLQRGIYPEEFPVQAIHAGLELGYFHEKNPELDLLCFGPEVEEMHSPSERVSISSVDRAWRLLRALLASTSGRHRG